MSQVRMGRPGRVRAALAALVGMALLAAGWWYWSRPRLPPVPEASFDGVDDLVRNAVTAARRKVEAEPRSAEAWGTYGKVLLAHQLTDEAVTALGAARLLAPSDPRWLYLEALAHYRYDPEKALGLLGRAAPLARGDERGTFLIRRNQASLLLALDRLDEAEAALPASTPDSDAADSVEFLRGLLAMRRGEWADGVRRLEPLADHPACRRRVAAQLSLAYLRLGDAAVSSRHARRATALEEDGQWPDAWRGEMSAMGTGRNVRLNQASALEEGRDPGQALALLQELERESGGKDALVYFSLGQVYRRLKRYDEAEMALRRSLAITPERYRVQHALASLLAGRARGALEAGQRLTARLYLDEAAKAAEAAAALAPQDVWGAYQLGEIRLMQEKPAEAEAPLRTAVAGRPEMAGPHLMLAECLALLGKRQEAEASFREAVRLALPGDARPAERLAYWLALWEAKAP